MALKQRLFIYGFVVKKSLKYRKTKAFRYMYPPTLGDEER